MNPILEPVEPDVDAPVVRNVAGSRVLQFAGRQEIQSGMSLLKPYALEIEYTRMMMGFLLFQPAPPNILMVGLGGGSLAKFCHRYLTHSCLDVVEIDPAVIALRREFLVPEDDERLHVWCADGADFVAGRRQDVDVLLIDGYDPDGMSPTLCEPAFYEHCYAALAEQGVLVLNLHLESPSYEPCLDALRDCFGAELFEVLDDDMTNSIVFACKGDRFADLEDLALVRPEVLSRDAWRQLLPTFQVIAATLVRR